MRLGIGDTLRAARRAQGRTLADAAAATRVRQTYLAALENEDFDALGGEVYARGFLRSYARFLELDPEPLVAAFREARTRREESRAPASRPARAAGARRERERPAGAAVLVALVVLVLLVIAVMGLLGDEAGAAGAAAGLWAGAGR